MVALHATYESDEHLLGRLKVVNRAVLNGAKDLCIVRRTPDQFVGVRAHRQHFARVFVNGHSRWLIQDHAALRRVDERVDRPQINRQPVRKETVEQLHDISPACTKNSPRRMGGYCSTGWGGKSYTNEI